MSSTVPAAMAARNANGTIQAGCCTLRAMASPVIAYPAP
jgi:hypothetical protein